MSALLVELSVQLKIPPAIEVAHSRAEAAAAVDADDIAAADNSAGCDTVAAAAVAGLLSTHLLVSSLFFFCLLANLQHYLRPMAAEMRH